MITFEPFLIYPSNFNSALIIYIIHVSDEFGTGALDLDHQDQISLQTSTEFEKNEPFFTLASNFPPAPRRPSAPRGPWARDPVPPPAPPPGSKPALCPARAGGAGPGPPPAPPPLHAGPLPRGPLPCAGLLHLGVPTAPAENGRGARGLSPPSHFGRGG